MEKHLSLRLIVHLPRGFRNDTQIQHHAFDLIIYPFETAWRTERDQQECTKQVFLVQCFVLVEISFWTIEINVIPVYHFSNSQ